MKNREQFNVAIRLNNQRAKNGLLPIYIKISVNGMRAEIATRHFINPLHWNSRTFLMKSGTQNEIAINTFINDVRGQLNQHYLFLVASKSKISSMILKNLFLGIEEDKPKEKTICEAFDYHNLKMQEVVDVGNISKQTLMRFKITKNKLIDFMKLNYNKEDMPISELRLRFVTEFDHFLLTVQKIQTNTAHKYIKNLKKIMNLAVGLDWIPSNPFNQFKCLYSSPNREILNQEELTAIMNKDFKIDRMNKVRDVFIFCCYTGFAYADVFQFENNAVTIGLDGEYWISKNRQKTGTKESVPLLPVALEIIERYRNTDYCVKNNKLLPVNSNQRYNSYLKELADVCGINKHLTSHIARHTFATTVTLANGVPIETVSSMLGHTSIRTTQIYAKVVEHKVSEDMKQLREKLHGPSNILRKII